MKKIKSIKPMAGCLTVFLATLVTALYIFIVGALLPESCDEGTFCDYLTTALTFAIVGVYIFTFIFFYFYFVKKDGKNKKT